MWELPFLQKVNLWNFKNPAPKRMAWKRRLLLDTGPIWGAYLAAQIWDCWWFFVKEILIEFFWCTSVRSQSVWVLLLRSPYHMSQIHDAPLNFEKKKQHVPSDVPAALEGWPVVKPHRVVWKRGQSYTIFWWECLGAKTTKRGYFLWAIKKLGSHHKMTWSYMWCMHASMQYA